MRDTSSSCPSIVDPIFCNEDIRFFRFYVGEPTNQPLGRALTSKGIVDIRLLNAVGSPDYQIFADDGEELDFSTAQSQPGRYLLALSSIAIDDDGFRVRLQPSTIQPTMFDLAFRDFNTGTISLAAEEIRWLSYEIRDEGPDTVVPRDLTDLQPVSIKMTAFQVDIEPNIAVFRENDGALIDSALTTGVSRLDLTLEAGDYFLATNGADTGYGAEFGIYPLTSGPGTNFGYDLTIGLEQYIDQTIESGGDTDYYRFTAEPTPDLGEIVEGPQALTFEITSADPTRDTELVLYVDVGLLLFEDDSGAAGNQLYNGDTSSLDLQCGRRRLPIRHARFAGHPRLLHPIPERHSNRFRRRTGPDLL